MPSSSRKRNPYSIEELLKKPEKKRRAEPIVELKADLRDINQQDCETNDEPNVNVETCD